MRKYYEQLELVKAELRKVHDEKFALSVQLDDTEQGFKETVRTKDGELKAMAVQLEERNQQLQTTSDELQKARRDINEERLNKGVVQSVSVANFLGMISYSRHEFFFRQLSEIS